MKRNIDDFNGMKDFIISIVTVIAWVLIGIIIAIGYFTMETKGGSAILSFISTIFTVISSLGIVATIGVYFWQKSDKQADNEKIIISYKMAIDVEKESVQAYIQNMIKMRETILSGNYTTLKIRTTGDIFTFILLKQDGDDINFNSFHFHMDRNKENHLNKIYMKLIELNCDSLKEIKWIIEAYHQLFSRLQHISVRYNLSAPHDDYIRDMILFGEINTLKVDYLLDNKYK
ncbi:hypothetical protein [Proteus mirabilis]|uniref:hypothetical protein n=1 Tax=Proteus mirabilis TaxID=584 RepID=UPI0013CFBF7A|nr:hypothetical protein [Proteus mirabilis]EKU2831539.1 hypothetical protein [Proteus mirabilis]